MTLVRHRNAICLHIRINNNMNGLNLLTKCENTIIMMMNKRTKYSLTPIRFGCGHGWLLLAGCCVRWRRGDVQSRITRGTGNNLSIHKAIHTDNKQQFIGIKQKNGFRLHTVFGFSNWVWLWFTDG